MASPCAFTYSICNGRLAGMVDAHLAGNEPEL